MSELKKRKMNECHIITDKLIKKEFFGNYFGFHAGESGAALFLYLYYKETGYEPAFAKANKIIEGLIESLEKGNFNQYSFCNGLCGFAWLLQLLKEEKLIDNSVEDLLEQLDAILHKELINFLQNGNIDFLHGALGIAVYFLRRKKNGPVELVLHYIDKTKEIDNKSYKWKSQYASEDLNEIKYDFGLAHGMSSYLYFLRKCIERNIQKQLSYSLLKGLVIFYKGHIQDYQKIGSYFPTTMEMPEPQPSHSRLSWCYGDLGIFPNLILAAKILDDISFQRVCKNALLQTTKRVSFKETFVKDASICHGESGNAYIYKILYQNQGDLIYKTAADYWYDSMIKNKRDKEYLFFRGNNMEPEASFIFLTGISGVGLSCLSDGGVWADSLCIN